MHAAVISLEGSCHRSVGRAQNQSSESFTTAGRKGQEYLTATALLLPPLYFCHFYNSKKSDQFNLSVPWLRDIPGPCAASAARIDLL